MLGLGAIQAHAYQFNWLKPSPGSKAVLLAYIPEPQAWAKLSAILVVDGAEAGLTLAPAGEGFRPGSRAVIIVGNPALLEIAAELASLHALVGVETEIVTVDEIVAKYPAAEPPPFTIDPEVLRSCCRRDYNASIALHIISFLREAVEKRVRYVVLLGSDRSIPPLYYHSPLLAYVFGSEHSLVPADYWFADPDYDFTVELAVGRIPFDNPNQVQDYVKALHSWHSLVKLSKPHILLAGGATFSSILMIGEASVEKASRVLGPKADVRILALTTGGYGPGTNLALAASGANMVYVVAHGLGNRLVDSFPNGLWGFQFAELLSVPVLETMRGPLIFITPACMSAEWDYYTVQPPFTPPSLGVAMVGKGIAVAYIGSSRIAIEAITGVGGSKSGELTVDYAGMVKLTELITTSLPHSRFVGDAVASALNRYLSMLGAYIAVVPGGVEDIVLLTAIELILLGDPVTPLPVFPEEPRQLMVLEPAKPYATVSTRLVLQPLAYMTEGQLPLYKPGTIVVEAKPCPDTVSVKALRRYYGYALTELVEVPYTVEESGEACKIMVKVNDPLPSAIVVSTLHRGVLDRRLLFVAGSKVVDGSKLLVTGLDLIRTIGDEEVAVTLDGRTYTIIPGALDGIVLDLPEDGGRLELVPYRSYVGLVAGTATGAEAEEILQLYTVDVPRVSLTYNVKGNTLYVSILVNGKPFNATLEAESPAGVKLYVSSSSTGVYAIRAYGVVEPVPVMVRVRVNVSGIVVEKSLHAILQPIPSQAPIVSPEAIYYTIAAAAAAMTAIVARRGWSRITVV